MGQIAEMALANGRLTTMFAKALLKDLEDSTFASHAPSGDMRIASNHPAFVYGHLALYASGVAKMLDLNASVCEAPDGFVDLFSIGKECRHDPDRTIYPSMDEITGAFFGVHEALFEQLPSASDSAFFKATPADDPMHDLSPTCGASALFMLGGHPMSHLGQVSVWRRAMGLGSALGF